MHTKTLVSPNDYLHVTQKGVYEIIDVGCFLVSYSTEATDTRNRSQTLSAQDQLLLTAQHTRLIGYHDQLLSFRLKQKPCSSLITVLIFYQVFVKARMTTLTLILWVGHFCIIIHVL